MSPRSVILTAALLLGSSTVRGDERGQFVVSVGSDGLAPSEIGADFGRLGETQRRALGSTPNAALRAFVDGVLVPRLLLSEHAKRTVPTAPRVVDLGLARALLEALFRSTRAPDPGEISAYYAAHLREFQEPASFRLWQIVVSDRALAQKIITECAGAKGPERWRNFAKDHSKDDATKYRAGDLGFVYEDGHTLVPALRVAPELFRAASTVNDGAIVPEPIPRDDYWVVLWRRGSRQATLVEEAVAAEGIVRALRHERFARERDALLGTLRKVHLGEYHPELLDHMPFDAVEVAPRVGKRPVSTPTTSASAPTPTERGLR